MTLASALGRLLAWLVGRVLGVRRAHVCASLRRAGIADAARVAAAMYRSLGTGVFELLALALLPWQRPRVQGLDEALAKVEAWRKEVGSASRGVVVATAHTGNWDLVACALASRVPLTVITKRLSVSWLNHMWQRVRAVRGVELVESGAAARMAGQRLRQGGWVAALIDQAPERSRATLSLPFLGATADVDLAPALLAQRARCPLLVAFPRRGARGHGVVVAGMLVPPPLPDGDWPRKSMQQATAWLEEFVRQHPEQWLWMHRRWKRVNEAGPRRPGRREGDTLGARV